MSTIIRGYHVMFLVRISETIQVSQSSSCQDCEETYYEDGKKKKKRLVTACGTLLSAFTSNHIQLVVNFLYCICRKIILDFGQSASSAVVRIQS